MKIRVALLAVMLFGAASAAFAEVCYRPAAFTGKPDPWLERDRYVLTHPNDPVGANKALRSAYEERYGQTPGFPGFDPVTGGVCCSPAGWSNCVQCANVRWVGAEWHGAVKKSLERACEAGVFGPCPGGCVAREVEVTDAEFVRGAADSLLNRFWFNEPTPTPVPVPTPPTVPSPVPAPTPVPVPTPNPIPAPPAPVCEPITAQVMKILKAAAGRCGSLADCRDWTVGSMFGTGKRRDLRLLLAAIEAHQRTCHQTPSTGRLELRLRDDGYRWPDEPWAPSGRLNMGSEFGSW